MIRSSQHAPRSLRPWRASLLAAPLLAAIGLSAGVQAQSVSTYGLIDLSFGRTQAPGGVASNGVDSGKMTTSYFGFKGSEDLGRGLNATFAIESFMRSDTGAAGRFNADTFWARNAFVALDGSWGKVGFGRQTTALFVQTLIFNAFGDSFGFSPSIRHYFTSGTTTGDTGWSDSVLYTSPGMGGASLTVQHALGEGDGGANTGANLRWFSGPMGAGLAWQQVKKGATTDDTTTWQLAGSYDLKVAKLYGQFGNVDNKTSGNGYRIIGLGATAPVSASGTVRAQWGQVDPDTGAKRSTLTLGYSHMLSKRSDLYAAYMSDRISGTGTGNSYSVGMRHRF